MSFNEVCPLQKMELEYCLVALKISKRNYIT